MGPFQRVVGILAPPDTHAKGQLTLQGANANEKPQAAAHSYTYTTHQDVLNYEPGFLPRLWLMEFKLCIPLPPFIVLLVAPF